MRTYEVRTYGCQMNVHDSERLAGSLEAAGLRGSRARGSRPTSSSSTPARSARTRTTASTATSGSSRRSSASTTGFQIAVGGCLAQKDRATIVEKAPWVDVVFGTHNVGALPKLLERARHNHEAQVEILESLEVFPSTLPTKRESTYSGWVSIAVGCNNTCTFCIVPSLRGKEQDRRPGDVLGEIRALVDDGAIEVTLLGQNVNTYGVQFGDRQAFGKLLRATGDIDGLRRVRFTSPHPAAFTDDVIDAMAETPTVMPQLHMPLQSGSDRILQAMRRSYRSDRYLRILDTVRDRIPDAAITTDIIVGFPGETDEDFEDTLRVVEQSRFASAFTFQYSIRPGTPAATMPDQVPKHVVQERYERLTALQDSCPGPATAGSSAPRWRCSSAPARAARTRRRTASPAGRATTGSCTSGCPTAPSGRGPGDLVTVRVTGAAPAFLIADVPAGADHRLERTRAGDAWDAREAASCAVPAPATAAEGDLARAAGAARSARLSGARADRADRRDRDGQDRAVPRRRGGDRGPPAAPPRSSTPTPCSCTAGWTSGPRSCRSWIGAASRTTASTCGR